MKVAIYTYAEPLFGRLCRSWARWLGRRGHEVSVHAGPLDYEPRPLPADPEADVHLVVAGAWIIQALRKHGFPDNGRTVLWMCDPLIDDPESLHHFKARTVMDIGDRFSAIAGMDEHIAGFVERNFPGVPAFRIPVVIDPDEVLPVPDDADRATDVLQLGLRSPRREQAEALFRREGVPVMFVYDNLYCERRYEVIRDARISLNIQYDENRYLNQHRIFDAWATGSVVVSEPSECMGRMDVVDGEHLVVAEIADMPAACGDLLADAPRRCRIAEAAQALLRRRYTTDRWVDEMERMLTA